MKFGTRLKKARTDQNLTQEQVAHDFFITRQTISSWENEKTYPDINSLIKLSDYYHISLDTLLKEDSGMKEYLEKKTIDRAITPTIILLLIIDCLFLALTALSITNIFQLNHETTLILIILEILNVLALLQLVVFKVRITTKKGKSLPNKKIGLFTSIVLMIAGVLCFSLINQSLLGGILSGIGFAIIMLYLFQEMISKFLK